MTKLMPNGNTLRDPAKETGFTDFLSIHISAVRRLDLFEKLEKSVRALRDAQTHILGSHMEKEKIKEIDSILEELKNV